MFFTISGVIPTLAFAHHESDPNSRVLAITENKFDIDFRSLRKQPEFNDFYHFKKKSNIGFRSLRKQPNSMVVVIRKLVQHWFSLTAKATQTPWFPLFTVRESQCWTSFQMTKTIKFGLLSQWAKVNVGLVFEMMKTIEFGLLS